MDAKLHILIVGNNYEKKSNTMRITLILFYFLILVSCGSKKMNLNGLDLNDNYQIKLKNAIISYNTFGNNLLKFGKTKDESITLNEVQLSVVVDGLKTNGVLDFNNFSLIDLKTKLRHRPEYAHCNTAFTSYSIGKIILNDLKTEDLFLKYSNSEYKNYDHYLLEHNWTGIGLSGTSIQTRFGKNLIKSFEKRIIKNKVFKLDFYTPNKKEGEFILYYKDKIVKKFSASKKMKKFKIDYNK
mgnify:CR=1 FL=1